MLVKFGITSSNLRYCFVALILRIFHGADCPVASLETKSGSTPAQILLQHRFSKGQRGPVSPREHSGIDNQSLRSIADAIGNKSGDVVNASLRDRSRNASHEEDPAGHDTGEVHHSIFKLGFDQLDKTSFWFVLVCMLAFTIVVDRAEAFATYKARNSATEQMFLARVNAELMMFGCVGLFLFIFKNIRDIPADQGILVEFVDILCSMGACGLIVMAGVLYMMRYSNREHWKSQENENFLGQEIQVQGPLELSSWRRYLNLYGPNSMDYQLMTKRFKIEQNLPDEFMYCEYLNIALARNACNLMDIDWTCWLLLLLIGLGFYGLHLLRKATSVAPMGPTGYVVGFELMNWTVFGCFCLMFCWVNSAHSSLLDMLRQDEQALQEKGVKMGDDDFETGDILAFYSCSPRSVRSPSLRSPRTASSPKPKKQDSVVVPISASWATRVKYWLQFLALVNSFLCAFYIMHLQYNLKASGFSMMIWLPCTLFPLLTVLFVMLPLIITKFTLVASFFLPDSNSLDEAIQMRHQLDIDIEYIRRMWEAKGEPQFPALEEDGVDEDEFRLLLREDLEIHISDVRCHRVFKAMDADHSGTISAEEFTSKISQILLPTGSAALQTTSFFSFAGFGRGNAKKS